MRFRIIDSVQQIRADLSPSAKGYLISFVITALLALHLLNSKVVIAGKQSADSEISSVSQTSLTQPATPPTTASHGPVNSEQQALQKVEVHLVHAADIQRELQVYGRTEANRSIDIKTELDSRVLTLHQTEGRHLTRGDSIATLYSEGLAERITHAEALSYQRKLELESAKQLEQSGFQAKLIVAEKATLLAEAQANLALLNKENKDRQLKTPFTGVLNKIGVEQGDFVQTGDVIAQILELDPIVVKIHVAETQVGFVEVGQSAHIELLDGRQYPGQVRYISAHSDSSTNTFSVEIVVANKDYAIPAGLSGKVTLLTNAIKASAVSPAFLTLNQHGQTGLYVVENGTARFKTAKILKSSARQLWVDSLGESAQVVIAGHQALWDGAPVDVQTTDQEAETDQFTLRL